MTYRRLLAFLCVAGFSLLSACSLFGMGPSQHTVVDYESLEPEVGHGADYDEQTRYGRTSTTSSRTGIEKPGYSPDYPADVQPSDTSDKKSDDTTDDKQE